MRNFILSIALFAILLVSCEKGPQIDPIKGMSTHTDETYKYTISYPTNWETKINPKRVISVSIPSELRRFGSYESNGLPAAKIDLIVISMDSLLPLDQVLKNNHRFQPEYYTAPESITIGGFPALKTKYEFELEDGFFNGEMCVVAADSNTATLLVFEAFGGSMEAYRSNFDEVLTKLVPAVTPAKRKAGDTLFLTEEQPFPSETLTEKETDFYKISIPENFKSEAVKDGGFINSKMYIGDRRGDSYIRVDVIDASKQNNLKKAFEQSIAALPSPTTKSLKIGGADAMMAEYKATSKISRRLYFVIKGNKMIRFTIDWFVPEQENYLPIFDKCIASVKLK